MRRGLMLAASAAAILFAGALLAAAVFLARPGLLLTSRSVGAALKRFGADFSPRWSSLRFSADALTLRRHRYNLSATDFCVADRQGVFSGCFSKIELSAVVFYSVRGPVVERIEDLVALARSARLDLRRLKAPEAPGVFAEALRSTSVDALRCGGLRPRRRRASSPRRCARRRSMRSAWRRPASRSSHLRRPLPEACWPCLLQAPCDPSLSRPTCWLAIPRENGV